MSHPPIDQDVLELAKSRRGAYLAALAAPAPRRAGVMALLALDAELARIPRIASEPALGRIRLQWWVDALGAIADGIDPGHPVAKALGDAQLSIAQMGPLVESHNFALDDGPANTDAHREHALARGGALSDAVCDVLGLTDGHARAACRRVVGAGVLADAIADDVRGARADGGAALRAQASDLLAQARATTMSASARRTALPVLLQAGPVERRLANPADPLGAGAVLGVWWNGIVGRF